jgi:YD repeat-containing protein
MPKYPEPSAHFTRKWDELNHMIFETDLAGHTWQWTRDSKGRWLTETGPDARVWTRTYQGGTYVETDPDGLVWISIAAAWS